MLIIPAIDIKDGKVVRLLQGKERYPIFYPIEPLKAALLWKSCGAPLLHIVDMDAVFHQSRKNLKLIEEIIEKVQIPVQLAGGLRSKEAVREAFKIGAFRVVLSTMAHRAPSEFLEVCEEFKGKVILSVDQRGGRVFVDGWRNEGMKDVEFAKKFKDKVFGILYTDIEADGAMSGPNIDRIKRFCEEITSPVLVAGGIRNVEDIKNLQRIKNVYGVIIGRALYEGTLKIEEAMDAYKEDNSLS